MAARQSTRVERVCDFCGVRFLVFASRVACGGGIVCSVPCRIARRRRQEGTLADRFLARVLKTETCWLWTSYKNPQGYGTISYHDRLYLAHRVSWELHNGPIPPGQFVLHNCPGGDDRVCVNPAHLWLGSHADNMADMAAKGRSLRGRRNLGTSGERHGKAKLTERQVRDIRLAHARGETGAAIARRYGVTRTTANDIIAFRRWKHNGLL